MNLRELYKKHCQSWGVEWQDVNSILSYDNTTLFCPAGMQQFKPQFKDESYRGTIANIQPCLRLNDLDLLGDGTHFAYFNMLGLFSFREFPYHWAVDFWLNFLQDLGLTSKLYLTIHPDKYDEWSDLFNEELPTFRRLKLEIKKDESCKWTDGNIGGYCTEFYVNHKGQDIEVGNVVNPLGNCIDFGGGLERLDNIVNNKPVKSSVEILQETILKIIESGIQPSNKLHGYVLRKLFRLFIKYGGSMNHTFFIQEKERLENLIIKYNKLKHKHLDKPKEWWYDTHGIDLDFV